MLAFEISDKWAFIREENSGYLMRIKSKIIFKN